MLRDYDFLIWKLLGSVKLDLKEAPNATYYFLIV